MGLGLRLGLGWAHQGTSPELPASSCRRYDGLQVKIDIGVQVRVWVTAGLGVLGDLQGAATFVVNSV